MRGLVFLGNLNLRVNIAPTRSNRTISNCAFDFQAPNFLYYRTKCEYGRNVKPLTTRDMALAAKILMDAIFYAEGVVAIQPDSTKYMDVVDLPCLNSLSPATRAIAHANLNGPATFNDVNARPVFPCWADELRFSVKGAPVCLDLRLS